jgi:hypothetical protein
MEWQEVRCNRERPGSNGQVRLCNALLGYTQIKEAYVAFYCRKCNAWMVTGSASFLPEKLPATLTTE